MSHRRTRPSLAGRRPILFVPVLLALFLSAAAAAGDGPLLGRVLDAETGRPLAEVRVGVQGGAAGTLTGDDGVFALAGAPEPPFTLVASIVGYEPLLRRVEAGARPGEELELRLRPTVYAAEESEADPFAGM